MSSHQIANAMIQGKMISQASMLSAAQLSNVADYLSEVEEEGGEWIDAFMCSVDRRAPDLSHEPTVATYGFDLHNTRRLSDERAGLDTSSIDDFKLEWAVAFPNAVSLRSQPAVVGSTVFVPVGESHNRLFAFDVSDPSQPCLHWVYEGGAAYFRSGAAYGVRSDGRAVVMVSDVGANLHMVDALTGEALWVEHFGLFENSMGTGTPVLVEDKVIAPSSQYEITQGGSDNYLCCRSHGGLVALDAISGKRIWEARTMPEAEPLYDRGDGQMIWGPSGAPVWNSPSVDLARRQVYFATGEANSPPAHANTDAIMAVDLDDGSIRWSYQATPRDIYIRGCAPGGVPAPGAMRLNCVPDPETVYKDYDFGASVILATKPDGEEIVIAGQKSGDIYALDPDTGELVWHSDPSPGGAVNWGMAIDDNRLYVPITAFAQDFAERAVPEDVVRGVFALNLLDGSTAWEFGVDAYCTPERQKYVERCATAFGFTAPTTLVGDLVIAGSTDGRLYALDRNTGREVWWYDASRGYDGMNGIRGNGGTFGNNAAVAAGGLLIVNSGYGVWGVGPGNVMLAFSPD